MQQLYQPLPPKRPPENKFRKSELRIGIYCILKMTANEKDRIDSRDKVLLFRRFNTN